MTSFRGTVLVVDDDPMVAVNHRDLLENAGYRCLWADRLGRAWRTISCQRPDLIVCDHDLPDGKGVALIRKLAEGGLDIPVVYVTAANAAHLPELQQCGQIRQVLSKPVDADDLLATVAAHVPPLQVRVYPRLIGQAERGWLLDFAQHG